MNTTDDSYCIGKEPCPKCRDKGNDRTGDNLARYSDGHGYCFACEHHEKGDGTTKHEPKVSGDWSPWNGSICDLPHRRIQDDVCRLYNYRVVRSGEDVYEVSNYYSEDGSLQAQHIRGKEKKFAWKGDTTKLPMFGQNLWKNNKGRRILVTEGEIDCLTMSQTLNKKYPVVSLPNGTASGAKAFRDNYEFLNAYDEIILMFDSDDAGVEAANKCAEILPPGKVKIVKSLPYKDPNECLMNNDGASLVKAFWEAQIYKPDGILHASEIEGSIIPTIKHEVWDYPFSQLTEFLIGQRGGEIVMWTSGTGSGKSTLVRELVNHHLENNRTVGMLMLEEAPEETLDDLISLRINKPIRKIKAMTALDNLRKQLGKKSCLSAGFAELSEDEYQSARKEISDTDLFIYDSHGCHNYKNLLSRIEYMAVSLGCKVIVLDHITAAVIAMMDSYTQDKYGGERLVIDDLMKSLRQLVERTGVHIDVISQLRKTQGRQYEEGGRIGLQDLRGSGSLASVPNLVVALERDRQSPDPETAHTSVIRVLKNRFTGNVGVATALRYDQMSGRMYEVEFVVDPDGNITFGGPHVETDI
jgi:twinkle protein